MKANQIKNRIFTIVVTGEKGGTGKSTITCLLTDYLNHLNKKVQLIDTDPLQVSQNWVDNCQLEGRKISTSLNYEYQIVDTAGVSGGSLFYIQKADVILVPFVANYADLLVITTWFATLKKELQEKVFFLPNRWQKTREQQEGYEQITKIIEQEGVGTLIPYLAHRPALYGKVLNGSKTNFFDHSFSEEAQQSFSQLPLPK